MIPEEKILVEMLPQARSPVHALGMISKFLELRGYERAKSAVDDFVRRHAEAKR